MLAEKSCDYRLGMTPRCVIRLAAAAKRIMQQPLALG
jgi:hypothetical protein